eukprot:1159623-Pelagomonas_calceolata.AAC.9
MEQCVETEIEKAKSGGHVLDDMTCCHAHTHTYTHTGNARTHLSSGAPAHPGLCASWCCELSFCCCCCCCSCCCCEPSKLPPTERGLQVETTGGRHKRKEYACAYMLLCVYVCVLACMRASARKLAHSLAC